MSAKVIDADHTAPSRMIGDVLAETRHPYGPVSFARAYGTGIDRHVDSWGNRFLHNAELQPTFLYRSLDAARR